MIFLCENHQCLTLSSLESYKFKETFLHLILFNIMKLLFSRTVLDWNLKNGNLIKGGNSQKKKLKTSPDRLCEGTSWLK